MRLRWDRALAPPQEEPASPEQADAHDASSSALRVMDGALCEFAGRGLASSAEVVNLLLDLRSAVLLDAAFGAVVHELGGE